MVVKIFLLSIMYDIFAKISYNQKRTSKKEKRLCLKLHTYFVLTAVGEHFDSLKRASLFHTCELGDILDKS